MANVFQDFFAPSQPYLAAFNTWAEKYSPAASADHICYKCGDTTEFERLRAMLEVESAFVYQSIIAGRRIAIVKFPIPIETLLGPIIFLELSDQKPDGSQTSGFDHIEIYPTSGTIEHLVSDLETKGMKLDKIVRPHHTTFDAKIIDDFKVRLEDEALVAKIKREEMI
ncbi:MAG: VOC family protein [Patescibacteria group bacterium]